MKRKQMSLKRASCHITNSDQISVPKFRFTLVGAMPTRQTWISFTLGGVKKRKIKNIPWMFAQGRVGDAPHCHTFRSAPPHNLASMCFFVNRIGTEHCWSFIFNSSRPAHARKQPHLRGIYQNTQGEVQILDYDNSSAGLTSRPWSQTAKTKEGQASLFSEDGCFKRGNND